MPQTEQRTGLIDVSDIWRGLYRFHRFSKSALTPHPRNPLDQRGAASFGQPSPCCRNTTRVERIGVGRYFAGARRGDFGDFGFTVFGAGARP